MRDLTQNSNESEKALERYLTRQVAALGGRALKYFNGLQAGYPDRICLLPGGRVIWVELKSKGAKARPIQCARIDELKALGQEVHVVSSRQDIDTLLHG